MDCSMVCPFSLVPDKQYSVTTHFDKKLCTIKGTFSRYERNKIMFKDDFIWSIVIMNWNCDELGHPDGNPCQIQLYLDPIDTLEFYEI
jgi:hypothetical protein